jgi:hypothetical protein
MLLAVAVAVGIVVLLVRKDRIVGPGGPAIIPGLAFESGRLGSARMSAYFDKMTFLNPGE